MIFAIALGALLVSACGRNTGEKAMQEESFTELLGELEEGCLGDTDTDTDTDRLCHNCKCVNSS